MRFDFAADPWGTAMLAAAALWLLSLLVIVAAFVAQTSRRTGGRMMLVSILAFLGAASGGTWVQIQQTEAIATQPPPPKPKTIVAKAPPVDPEDGRPAASGHGTGETAGAGDPAEASGTADPTETRADDETAAGGTGGPGATDAGGSTGADEPAAAGAGADEGALVGDDAAPDPSERLAPVATIPERVLPEAIPQVPALPTEPQAREAAIRDILGDAQRAAGGGRRCGNLERVAQAWARLRTVPVDRKAKAITADLEKCRRKLLYSISRRYRAERVEARDAYFDALRERMRKEHGLMVQASISGKSHERLRIGSHELDAAKADALMNGGLRAELMGLEFAHVVLSSGKEARTYELEVPPESELGLPDLRAVGLGEPLAL